MGNALRCFEGGADDHAGRDRYPYYRPTSNLGLQAGTTDAPPPPPTHRWVLDHHGVAAAAAGLAALDHQYILDFKPPASSMPAAQNFGHLQGSNEYDGLGRTVVTPQSQQRNTYQEDIDESSAEVLRNAKSYAKSNAMLVEVPVLGTSRTFWRLSDDAARISRKLALILNSHHKANKYLTAPLQLSNIWISSSRSSSGGSVVGSVKLRGVRFSGKRFSLKRVRDDYRDLARVLQALIRVSSGGNGDDVANKLPPDYRNFLALLVSDAIVTMEDEFLIVNNPALLPMSNRTEVFLVFHDRIVTTLGRTKGGKKKRSMILSKLPYEQDWLDTARANTQINRYVTGAQNPYKRTQLDQLRLNRNVRSHPHEYNNDDIEEALYCEWPELLTEMARILHLEGELQGTGIHNKFG